ncbi:hypothetical protein NDA14_005598 [Ustilago hordei]|nr:hypothetical protein NDA15_001129 [Ustilago hordei]KAJ1603318.1 hypothetical protein NDA14_005598 [Ustilago hordei]
MTQMCSEGWIGQSMQRGKKLLQLKGDNITAIPDTYRKEAIAALVNKDAAGEPNHQQAEDCACIVNSVATNQDMFRERNAKTKEENAEAHHNTPSSQVMVDDTDPQAGASEAAKRSKRTKKVTIVQQTQTGNTANNDNKIDDDPEDESDDDDIGK